MAETTCNFFIFESKYYNQSTRNFNFFFFNGKERAVEEKKGVCECEFARNLMVFILGERLLWVRFRSAISGKRKLKGLEADVRVVVDARNFDSVGGLRKTIKD